MTDSTGPLIPDGLDATLVLLRHGESTLIAEGRFQGQAETPLTAIGRRQAELGGARLAEPHAPPALPVPVGPPLEIVHSPLGRTSRDGRGRRGGHRRGRGADRRGGPIPGFLEIGQGEWQGLHRDRDRRPVRRDPRRLAPGADGVLGAGGESLADVAVRVRPALATMLERLADGRQPGSLDRSQVPGHGDAPPDHRWSVVVAHDGVFKIALLTLFDLPIDRFWMWTMDLCGISVVELRAGRPVLRALQLDGASRPVGRRGRRPGTVEAAGQTEAEARRRAGAL